MGFRVGLVLSPASLEQLGLGGLLIAHQPSPIDRVSLPLLHGTHMALVHGVGIWDSTSAIEAIAMDGGYLDQKGIYHLHMCSGVGGRFGPG